jgi:hypothetical protein
MLWQTVVRLANPFKRMRNKEKGKTMSLALPILLVLGCCNSYSRKQSWMMGRDITLEYILMGVSLQDRMNPKEVDRIYPFGKAGKLVGSSCEKNGHRLYGVSNDYIFFS